MAFNYSGITTGLLGYSRKNEMFSDSLPFKTVETFSLEIYSSDLFGLSAATIHSHINQQFSGLYYPNIDVKVFNVLGEFQMPSDSIRNTKFNVEVIARSCPNNPSGYSELGNVYYTGIDTGFYQNYSAQLIDFKEDFDFEKGNNGVSSFNHTVSFGLMSGGKPLATQIISGLFKTDYNIPLGIVAFVSGLTGANPDLVQNYYTESYDLIRNSFSFSKKREFLPADYAGLNYNLNHSISLQEDGTFNVNEKCDLKAKISFLQAQQGLGLVYGGAYTRCSDFYNLFNNYANPANCPSNSLTLFTTPKKYTQTFNKPSLEAGYDVSYTNDPRFFNTGVLTQEIIELDVDNKNIVTISDKYDFTFNKRTPNTMSAYNLIVTGFNSAATNINSYYTNSCFYTPSWPMNQTKYSMSWPYNKNKASVNLTYSNNPRNNVTVNGVHFNVLDYTIDNNVPQDMVTEYKVINRPTKFSVLNYAYQSSVGEITVNFTAQIGRLTNEWMTGFREDIGIYLYALYQYGTTLFMAQFNNVVPLNFNFYLADVKYNLNNDGILTMNLKYSYTIKKYLM
jgi:hypothetical protein